MTSRKLRQTELQFDYFSENYRQFEEDFYQYSAMSLPLTFISDDLLLSMAGSQSNFFVLNKHNSIDQTDHYFIFKVKMASEAKMVRIYEYVGHQKSLDY
ncbi:DUF5960 family protein [Fundicoccus sp. Sow4_D5]|uniref:DUF5960 family protein n=1 Tax=Fundicoccus sp. Sow4_D5 TaxID=3438782 RepID=UPI003F8F5A75